MLLVLLCLVGASVSHYRFELKHYSADVFWALLLPALALWATTAGSPGRRWPRQLTFAVVAGAALWTSYGALFVAPGCLAWIVFDSLRRRDRAEVLRSTLAVVVWLSFFAVNYAVSLRHTHQNDFLRRYWSDRVPPPSAGALDRLIWIGEQLPELVRNAGGTRLPTLLFLVGIGGLLLAPDRRLAVVYGTVPVAAVLLAATRLVPVYERFWLWVIPSLYLGVAFAFDRGVRGIVRGIAEKRAGLALGAVLTWCAALPVSSDVLHRGWQRLELGRPDDTNHGMDDRRGVPWLMRQRQAGDAIVASRLAWPAVWWYGGLSLSEHPVGRLPDGSTFYELTYDPGGQPCAPMGELLRGHRRVLLYVSFPDCPDAVLARIEREVLGMGTLAARRAFTSATWAAVIRMENSGPAGTSAGDANGRSETGCIGVKPAVRW